VLSKLGMATRTQAAVLIESGRVSVNGRAVRDPRRRIDMGKDTVTIDGEIARAAPRRYLALNKPRGLVTTLRDEQGRTTVYHCLNEEDKRLAPVGRLDKASEGLLLFTNDTQWAHRILDPNHPIPKTYHVQIDRRLTTSELARLRAGIEIEPGVTTRPARIDLLRTGDRTCWMEITLHQGLNRQIRRMIEAVDAKVLRLIRIRIGPIELGTLAKGQTRYLSPQELARLPGGK
jgi:23S rRNA pseudouridine2605 synthase